MGYNTRRKSLSLPSLGIALPGGPRAARSPPTTADSLHVGHLMGQLGLRPGLLGDAVLLDAELRVARVWTGPALPA